mmetsp:Transcript_26140/g.78731  ORF Transcript_26140/g.78731 Transcript_26140/m.78731 type:complete len:145 (-) Transcript_26140:120-554(-)
MRRDQAGSTVANALIILGNIAQQVGTMAQSIADSNERARQESGRGQATAEAIVQAVRSLAETRETEASARDERAEEANSRNEASTKPTIEAIKAVTIAHQAEAATQAEELKFLKDSIEEKREISLIKATEIKIRELIRHKELTR